MVANEHLRRIAGGDAQCDGGYVPARRSHSCHIWCSRRVGIWRTHLWPKLSSKAHCTIIGCMSYSNSDDYFLICSRVVKFWDTRKFKTPVVQTPPNYAETSEGVSAQTLINGWVLWLAQMWWRWLSDYLSTVVVLQLLSHLILLLQSLNWLYFMWACDIHDLFSSAHCAFQVGRVHGIASLSQDPTSSRLIASCTDNKWVSLRKTMDGI